MRNYFCLKNNNWKYNNYSLVPIRDEDKYEVLKWRNAQIDILRQKKVLSIKEQEDYFKYVVDELFKKEKAEQLLFSFLLKDELIGYGGLVHIDWDSKNAEISFLISSNLEFELKFSIFLKLIYKIAFEELGFVKIHTTLYDLDIRKEYIKVLQKENFVNEAVLKRHIFIKNDFYDVKIYSKFME